MGRGAQVAAAARLITHIHAAGHRPKKYFPCLLKVAGCAGRGIEDLANKMEECWESWSDAQRKAVTTAAGVAVVTAGYYTWNFIKDAVAIPEIQCLLGACEVALTVGLPLRRRMAARSTSDHRQLKQNNAERLA